MSIKKSLLITLFWFTFSGEMVYPALSFAISNGTSVPQGEFLFFGLMGKKDDPLIDEGWGSCGSALVAPHWILTARHCVIDPKIDIANMKIIFGVYDLWQHSLQEFSTTFTEVVAPSFYGHDIYMNASRLQGFHCSDSDG